MTGQGRGSRGQAHVELAVSVVLLVTLTMGIIEFGRAFMVANVITHAGKEWITVMMLPCPSGSVPGCGGAPSPELP